MIPAAVLFVLTYVLMMTFGKYRPYIALVSGLVYVLTGMLPVSELPGSLDFNVLLMIGGTMGIVQLFIDSRMPERLADQIMNRVPNVRWAGVCLSLFAGLFFKSGVTLLFLPGFQLVFGDIFIEVRVCANTGNTILFNHELIDTIHSHPVY